MILVVTITPMILRTLFRIVSVLLGICKKPGWRKEGMHAIPKMTEAAKIMGIGVEEALPGNVLEDARKSVMDPATVMEMMVSSLLMVFFMMPLVVCEAILPACPDSAPFLPSGAESMVGKKQKIRDDLLVDMLVVFLACA
jgi:hypothetical protein